ncbi:YqaE/Pmp3 family membrane protein [Marinobacter confluentis]|uniref:YqaE/Pmp3 family membrane protein n=1 Tax=Marinobacter confluentis TaxID=1697557 RepID=A0A4Z1BNG8_9GAMM|nr:YqaE/Pmp3 family membrane protein [Marinobacter confluentis]
MDPIRVLIAILLPPLGVFLQVGIGKRPRRLDQREEIAAQL